MQQRSPATIGNVDPLRSDIESNGIPRLSCHPLATSRVALRSIKREKRNRERAGRRKEEYDDGDDEESVGFLSDQPRHYLNIPTRRPLCSLGSRGRPLVRSLFYTLFTLTALFFFSSRSRSPLSRARASRRVRSSRTWERSTFADNAIVNRARTYFHPFRSSQLSPPFLPLISLSHARARNRFLSRRRPRGSRRGEMSTMTGGSSRVCRTRHAHTRRLPRVSREPEEGREIVGGPASGARDGSN